MNNIFVNSLDGEFSADKISKPQEVSQCLMLCLEHVWVCFLL